MRVLFTSEPGWGHVHPMVPLAQAFLERGDEIAWATGAEQSERLRAELGIRAEAVGMSVRDGRAQVMTAFPEIFELPPLEFPDHFGPRLFAWALAPVALPDLLALAREVDPALVVADTFDFGAPIVAALLGIPCVSHAFGALIPRHRMERSAEYVAPLWEQHGLTPRPFGGVYDHLYIDIYPPSLGAADADYLPDVQPQRPSVFATGEEAALPEALTAEGPPLVYATLGTVFNEEPDLFVAMAQAIGDLEVRGVLTVGPAGDPARLGAVPANVHVARYIPQAQLLPHCAAVMSHTGSGTFLASLAVGVPQVCIPLAADQFGNAAAGARAGVAVVVDPGDRSVERIRAALSQVLDDDVLRKNAALVQADIEAMPAPAEVAEVLAARFG